MALRSAARTLRLVLGLAVVAEVSRARGSPRCSCDQHSPALWPVEWLESLCQTLSDLLPRPLETRPTGAKKRECSLTPAGRAGRLCGQGVECQQSLIPALITTGSYGKERKKRGVPIEQETEGYCVQFQLGPIPSCRQVRAPHAQWTRYLTQGHTVCVRCEWPAQNARSWRCYGDGGGARGNQLLQWQAAGHPCCRGIWERLRQLRDFLPLRSTASSSSSTCDPLTVQIPYFQRLPGWQGNPQGLGSHGMRE